MNTIAILAPSRHHMQGFLAVNPWINPGCAIYVESESDIVGCVGLVFAMRDWQLSPSIARPRAILERINSSNGLQLVVLENHYVPMAGTLTATRDVASDRVERPIEGWNQYDGKDGNGYQPIDRGGKVLPPPSSR